MRKMQFPRYYSKLLIHFVTASTEGRRDIFIISLLFSSTTSMTFFMVNHISVLGKVPESNKDIPEIRAKCTAGSETLRFPFSKDKT